MRIKVKIDQQVFAVEITDLAARPIIALVDGQIFEVWPEEEGRLHPVEVKPVDKPVPLPSFPKPAAPTAPVTHAAPAGNVDKDKVVLAPIPGVILSVSVTTGASIQVGQELCVLEAMKMKNVIRSTRAGVISNIYVSEGDHVKHGQVLLDFAG